VKAYILAEITIHDPQTYERYKLMAPPSIAKYGGTYLVRGATTTTLEGSWQPSRFVILEFPSGDAARSWWNSPEYAEAKALRHSISTTDMLLVEGPPFDPRTVST
jgi:uncharacterized protein (DUF1330 family)